MDFTCTNESGRRRLAASAELLPSLAQQVRGRRLKMARGILLVLGVLFGLGGAALMAFSDAVARAAVDQELKKEIGGRHNVDPERSKDLDELDAHSSRAVKIVGGLGIVLGISYLLFSFYVTRYPAPITIVALAMFVACNAIQLAVADSAEEIVAGWPLKIGIIVALALPIQSAIAYERERIHQERLRQRRQLRQLERELFVDSGENANEVLGDREPRRATLHEDAWPIKAVLWFFGILLAESIFYGWYLHWGGGLPAGPKETMATDLLEQMLIFDVFSSVLVIVALLVTGRPPPIEPTRSSRMAAWWLGAPVLGVVLGINFFYGWLLQQYLGKHPFLEAVEITFETDFWLVLLTVCIQPAIIEELFFRYLTLGQLRRIMGDGGAIWVSAVMFGFAHLHNPAGVPVLILIGASFGYMRVMSGGLALPMLMHGFHNAIVTLLAG